MSLQESPDRSDVVDRSLDHIELTVGISPVEVKVGGSRSSTRQIVVIYNADNSKTMFWGKSTVTATGSTRGFPILPGQFVSLPFGDVPLYLIGEQAGMKAIVAEIG